MERAAVVDGLAGELLHERTTLAFTHTRRAVADDPVGHVRRRVLLQLAALLVVHRRASHLGRAPSAASSSADRSEGEASNSTSLKQGLVGSDLFGGFTGGRCGHGRLVDAELCDHGGGPPDERGLLELLHAARVGQCARCGTVVRHEDEA